MIQYLEHLSQTFLKINPVKKKYLVLKILMAHSQLLMMMELLRLLVLQQVKLLQEPRFLDLVPIV